jgi:hypothetical protein
MSVFGVRCDPCPTVVFTGELVAEEESNPRPSDYDSGGLQTPRDLANILRPEILFHLFCQRSRRSYRFPKLFFRDAQTVLSVGDLVGLGHVNAGLTSVVSILRRVDTAHLSFSSTLSFQLGKPIWLAVTRQHAPTPPRQPAILNGSRLRTDPPFTDIVSRFGKPCVGSQIKTTPPNILVLPSSTRPANPHRMLQRRTSASVIA